MIARKPVRFFLSIALVAAAAWIGSMVTYPSIQNWYAELDKPFFNPPNLVFGPVWTVLYAFMAISLYLVWTAKTSKSRQFAYWMFGVQLVLNTTWSVAFFGLHLPWVSVGVIVTLWLAIALTIGAFWGIRRLAAYLLVPYLAWVAFATALTISIAMLNPPATAAGYKGCTQTRRSVIQTSYPEVCVAPDGKRFTNPDATAPMPVPQQDSLSVPELGAIIQLGGNIGDAYYSYDKDTEEIYLTTTRLEGHVASLAGCTSGLRGLYVKREDSMLREQPRIETLCLPADSRTTGEIYSIQDDLRAAIGQATVE